MNDDVQGKGVAKSDPLTIDQEGVVEVPWLERPLKERRRLQHQLEQVRKTQGPAAARAAWYRVGKPLSPEMLRILDQDGIIKRG